MAEADTKELDALLAALNASAGRLQTLWFSFLGLTLYLAITALTTTHRMLLLGEDQTLPILNMKVPLLPFYVIAPLFYVVIHFYVLMMLVLLARTTVPFEEQLLKAFPGAAASERYRARAENALFLQLLIGPKQERDGANGFLLAVVGLVTLAMAPIATLIVLQMAFLPYHSFGITWEHRALVGIDFCLVMMLWASYRSERGVIRPLNIIFYQFGRGSWRAPTFIALGWFWMIAVVWLCLCEGRWAGEDWIGRSETESQGFLFGLFPDRLILPHETIVGADLIEKSKKESASRGKGAFVPTQIFDQRNFVAAQFGGADLRGVSFRFARMFGVDLSEADLRGADVSFADFGGANLSGSDLRGVEFNRAVLLDARMVGVRLQGVELAVWDMPGADLRGAFLQGSDLKGANLQGADLSGAQMQGADLTRANLQGANLDSADLQGADFTDAFLRGAHLSFPFVYRTKIEFADLLESLIRSPELGQHPETEGPDGFLRRRRATSDDLAQWIAEATAFAKTPLEKQAVIARFERLKTGFRTPEEDIADIAQWQGWAEMSQTLDPEGNRNRRVVATIFGDLACDKYVNSDVVFGLMKNLKDWSFPTDERDDFRSRMRVRSKNPAACPGVAGFTDADWRRLDAVEREETGGF